ncbi:alpha/beta fold hydrolase [Motilimonas pumila]|uniref:Alpha/beta fold hydrolase n=1 Tax=Motilimonas pumila TaxID=2303987 RepID=A0A418YAI8_9GAMM|nr:alpha/beta fold hydrolase [Motilimonas pumila]RJG39543.1 alpha/beta fold hydrolase [Motilimonas pumila]
MQRSFKYSILSSALLLGLSACGGGGGGGQGFTAPVVEAPISDNCPGNLTCNFLAVPRNYQDESEGTVNIHYGIHLATNPASRIGTLFVNYGGPGGDAVQATSYYIDQWIPAEILERFDIVAMDPRGAGKSAFVPEITECGQKLYQGDNCPEVTVNIAPDMGTNTVARDMDSLRAHLGEDTISYLGYSYGTRLGSVYSSLFPERIRALVLDSPVSPTIGNVTGLAFSRVGAYESIAKFRLNSDQRFQALEGLALQYSESETYIAGDGESLSAAEAAEAITLMTSLEASGYWQTIQSGVFELLDNNNAALLKSQLPKVNYPTLVADDYRFNAMFKAVMCTDESSPLSANEIDAMFPDFMNESLVFGLVGYVQTSECYQWNGEQDPIPVIENMEQVLSGQKVLLVAGELDPRTPYSWGVQMENSYGDNAALVTVTDVVEHGFSFTGFSCVDKITTSYLIDPSQEFSDTACPGNFQGRSAIGDLSNHPVKKNNQIREQLNK